MVIITVVGAVYFLVARPDKKLAKHMHPEQLEPTGAERAQVTSGAHPYVAGQSARLQYRILEDRATTRCPRPSVASEKS